MVARATGMIAATAIQEGLGSVICGKAKTPALATSAGTCLKRLTPVVSEMISAATQPTMGPSSRGSWPSTPLR